MCEFSEVLASISATSMGHRWPVQTLTNRHQSQMPLKITVNMLALPGASEALWIQTLSQTAQQFHTPTFRGKLNHEVYPLSHPIPTDW